VLELGGPRSWFRVGWGWAGAFIPRNGLVGLEGVLGANTEALLLGTPKGLVLPRCWGAEMRLSMLTKCLAWPSRIPAIFEEGGSVVEDVELIWKPSGTVEVVLAPGLKGSKSSSAELTGTVCVEESMSALID